MATAPAVEALLARLRSNGTAADRLRVARLWTAFFIALAVFDAWAICPYLSNELARLEPWKAAALFLGDAVAALWFLRFALTHLILRKPLEDQPASERSRWIVGIFIGSMTAGLLLDFAFTLYLDRDEKRAYAAGTSTTAIVHNMFTYHASEGRNWRLDCEWRDAATGQTHRGWLRLHAGPAKRIGVDPPGPPYATAHALGLDQTPKSVPIRYDTHWPNRGWLEGVPDDDNGLFFVSLAVFLIQAVVIALAGLIAWGQVKGIRPKPALPWWIELGKVIPTAAEIIVFAFCGFLFRTIGW